MDKPAGNSDWDRALSAAKTCGVTRLGDITHLDCLGVPVFHAVRPWSRSLSVHQGKGLTARDARIGALMEAVESAHAEAFEAAPRHAAWRELAPEERAPRLDDFACERAHGPMDDEPLAWVPARRIADGGVLWAPFDGVSLDFSRPVDRRLAQTSNGQAAHFETEAATGAALLEVIERDAVAAWFARSATARSRTIVGHVGIPYPWWQDLRARIEAVGVQVTIYELPTVIGYPALLTELKDAPGAAAGPIVVYGTACHPLAESALKASVLEAAQSRVTEIAGARDDILYSVPVRGGGMGLSWPRPPGMPFRGWGSVPNQVATDAAGPMEIARRLAAAGYRQASAIDLDAPGSDVAVVKAFVPGLGANRRARRAPEPFL